MKRISLIYLLIILIFQSCAPSNSVNGGFIQKRKYTKGFHIAKRGKINSKKEKVCSEEYSYRGDYKKNISRDKKQEFQGESDLLEPNCSKNDVSSLKNEEENGVREKNVRYDPNNGVEESVRKTSNISNAIERSILTLGAKEMNNKKNKTSNSDKRSSDIIQGLSLASLVFSGIGFFFICFWFFFWGTFESVVLFWGLGVVFFLAAFIFLIVQSKEASRSDRLWVFISGSAAALPVLIAFIAIVSILIIASF
ncbi:MAG: hypothetical protein AB8B56_04615 [Crocinitomicaceae bacterium]